MFSDLRGLARRAAAARGGGVAIMFALSLLPLALVSLGTIDITRAVMARGSLQDALDAASLSIARDGLTDPVAIQRRGEEILLASLGPEMNGYVVVGRFQRVNGVIVGDADTTITGTMILDSLPVSVHSETTAKGKNVEVVLVLDNTYSMVLDANDNPVADVTQTKLYKLKQAANAFVDKLTAAAHGAEEGAVKIAVVPFSNTVNVGPAYKTATWMDRDAVSPLHDDIFSAPANRFSLLLAMGQEWKGCVEARGAGHDVLDTAPTAADPNTLFVPYFAPDEPDLSSWSYHNNYLADRTTNSNWKVRQSNVAKYDRAPSTTAAFMPGSQFGLGYRYGPNWGCQLQALVRLTTNHQAIKNTIALMTAVGDTNIPAGLVWGWHLLAPHAPFADGVAYDDQETKKIIVLMTDGQNRVLDAHDSDNQNNSFYSSIGYIWMNRLGITSGTDDQRRAALDSRLSTLCTNIKNKKIIIYTVRVEVADGSSTVLRNCATTPAMFRDVQNASQLEATFDAIAGEITELRLSQ
jgi:Flp pilus assembly protein TadG